MAWNLCYICNFSPHKPLIWNNADITIKNKTILWYDSGICNVISLFDRSGVILTYEQFLSRYNLPVLFKEFNSIIKAIPEGLTQLIINDLSFGEDDIIQQKLMLNGTDIG